MFTEIFEGQVIVGPALTVTVAVMGVPMHPFAVGVMVNVTVTALLVELVRLPLISPEPLGNIPVTVAVLSLVQLKMVEGTVPDKTIVVIASPEQMV